MTSVIEYFGIFKIKFFVNSKVVTHFFVNKIQIREFWGPGLGMIAVLIVTL